jgi:hypothetical protein
MTVALLKITIYFVIEYNSVKGSQIVTIFPATSNTRKQMEH